MTSAVPTSSLRPATPAEIKARRFFLMPVGMEVDGMKTVEVIKTTRRSDLDGYWYTHDAAGKSSGVLSSSGWFMVPVFG